MSNFSPNPLLLLHPPLPDPLHGVNPRTINGRKWWDATRKEAYAKHGDRCWACGIHKNDARFRKHLEAHECYAIDYRQGIAHLDQVVALCHSCHNYIHSNRMLRQMAEGHMNRSKYLQILAHGERQLNPILENCPTWEIGKRWRIPDQETQPFQLAFPQVAIAGLSEIPPQSEWAKWSQWRLVVDGVEYYSPFKNQAEHDAFYQEKQQRGNEAIAPQPPITAVFVC